MNIERGWGVGWEEGALEVGDAEAHGSRPGEGRMLIHCARRSGDELGERRG